MPENRLLRQNVSRETLEKLKAFEALVQKWTQQINLISKSSYADVWTRHIEDSAQLVGMVSAPAKWVDLGSGGGFPGLVVAILLNGLGARTRTTLIESDGRKSAFLRVAARELDLQVSVNANRIEKVDPLGAGVVSARALAPLEDLMPHVSRHIGQGGVALLMKGESWQNELSIAQEKWSFSCEAFESQSNPKAAVLKIADIAMKR